MPIRRYYAIFALLMPPHFAIFATLLPAPPRLRFLLFHADSDYAPFHYYFAFAPCFQPLMDAFAASGHTIDSCAQLIAGLISPPFAAVAAFRLAICLAMLMPPLRCR